MRLADRLTAAYFSAVENYSYNIAMIESISIFATSLFAAAVAWSAHGQNSEGIPAGIKKLHKDDITATIARDIDALTALYDDDAVLLQPGAPAIVGKAAFRDFMKQALAKSPSVKNS